MVWPFGSAEFLASDMYGGVMANISLCWAIAVCFIHTFGRIEDAHFLLHRIFNPGFFPHPFHPKISVEGTRMGKPNLPSEAVPRFNMFSISTIIEVNCENSIWVYFQPRKVRRLFNVLDLLRDPYIAVQSRGVDLKLVESLLIETQSKSIDNIVPLEDVSLWKTFGKAFEEWICPLVYSLIHHADDIILRLCQDIVLHKAPLAELVFPHVLGNLAGRSNISTHVCKLVSSQVEENIFTESNESLRSIQVVLDAMNELRLRYVLDRAKSTSESTKKRDISKSPCLPSSSGSRSSRGSRNKQMDPSTPIKSNISSSYDWEKVYWLHIDYLLAAKAAIRCASYFTSVLYVEHWCEEHFESLTLGDPDFSHHERLPAHVEVLMTATTNINEPDGIYGIRSQKLPSQILTYEHEGNWSKALENYDLVLRTTGRDHTAQELSKDSLKPVRSGYTGQELPFRNEFSNWNYHKGLIKSLQQTGCSHVLDLYCQGLAAKESVLQQDLEFVELQYEAAWRTGTWDFYCISPELNSIESNDQISRQKITFNANLHSCLRCLDEGDANMFRMKMKHSKQALVSFVSQTSRESTQYIHSVIVKLQILDQLSQAWEIRWRHIGNHDGGYSRPMDTQLFGPSVPSIEQCIILANDLLDLFSTILFVEYLRWMDEEAEIGLIQNRSFQSNMNNQPVH
ncbi:hypothetical protein KI387_003691, partial [Taxus chinensis]